MNEITLTALVTVLTPFITQITKQGLDKTANYFFMFQDKLPMSVRIVLPIIIGAVLQAGGSVLTGTIDPATGAALGAMAGGLASSGRDLIHKRNEHK